MTIYYIHDSFHLSIIQKVLKKDKKYFYGPWVFLASMQGIDKHDAAFNRSVFIAQIVMPDYFGDLYLGTNK